MWTIELMRKLSKEVGGTGFDTVLHPERTFDEKVWEGDGGVYVVMGEKCKECGGTHYFVRKFFTEGEGAGRTNNVFMSNDVEDARKVAALLSSKEKVTNGEVMAVLTLAPGKDDTPDVKGMSAEEKAFFDKLSEN